jgi:hypothetical protein
MVYIKMCRLPPQCVYGVGRHVDRPQFYIVLPGLKGTGTVSKVDMDRVFIRATGQRLDGHECVLPRGILLSNHPDKVA